MGSTRSPDRSSRSPGSWGDLISQDSPVPRWHAELDGTMEIPVVLERPPSLAALPGCGLQALEVESGIVQNSNDDAQQEIASAQDDSQQEITSGQNDTRLRFPEEEAVQSSEGGAIPEEEAVQSSEGGAIEQPGISPANVENNTVKTTKKKKKRKMASRSATTSGPALVHEATVAVEPARKKRRRVRATAKAAPSEAYIEEVAPQVSADEAGNTDPLQSTVADNMICTVTAADSNQQAL